MSGEELQAGLIIPLFDHVLYNLGIDYITCTILHMYVAVWPWQ